MSLQCQQCIALSNGLAQEIILVFATFTADQNESHLTVKEANQPFPEGLQKTCSLAAMSLAW